MGSRFEEFHAELRSVAGDLLAKDRAVDWPLLVQSGWVGLEVPDEFGGAGATFREAAVVCEEMGRAASANAYLGGAVLAVGALTELAPTRRRDQLLAGIAAGTVRAAGVIGPFALDGQRLTGKADFVPDAADADVLLVTATDSGGVPVLVETTEATVTSQPVLDETRRLATVNADHAAIESVWPLPQPQRLLDRAAVAVACDSLGVAGAMLDATVAYAGVREQFGRPIGSFQAVKHACADMLVRVSVARELVAAAAQRLAGDPPGDPETSVAASMAKSYACAAAVAVAGRAMQLHGGMGYTWESGIHVFLKRAALNRSLSGSPAAHRRRLARRYREG